MDIINNGALCILSFKLNWNWIEKLSKSKTDNVAMMIDLESGTNLKNIGLTLQIKVNHQG